MSKFKIITILTSVLLSLTPYVTAQASGLFTDSGTPFITFGVLGVIIFFIALQFKDQFKK